VLCHDVSGFFISISFHKLVCLFILDILDQLFHVFPSRNSLVVFKGTGLRGGLDVVLDGYLVGAVFVLDGDVCHFILLIATSNNVACDMFFSFDFRAR